MKTIIYTALVAMCVATASAQVAVDPAISASAKAAVEKLGTEMKKGNFNYGHQNMYQRWKRRLAKSNGGMKALDAKFAAAARQKAVLGLTVTRHTVSEPASFFSVWKSKKIDPTNGKAVLDATGKPIIVDHWLTIVPTLTRVKVRDPKTGAMREVEEGSFTVAISEKGSNKWSFLTGMKPSVKDLRSLFPSLPLDAKALGIPRPTLREIK